MRPALILIACLAAAPAVAETPAPADAPLMPGDPNGAAPVWHGMSECASILAVASSRATSFIERDRMKEGAAMWFTASGDRAAAEDALPPAEEWAELIEAWSGKIGFVGSLDGMGDWMTYCAHIGGQAGLPSQTFEARLPAPPEDAPGDS